MMQFDQVPENQIKQYEEISDKAIEQFKAVISLTPENKWEQNSDKNGFQIHLKPDKETGLNFTRGEGFLPYTIDQIFEVIDKVENALQYDELCEQANVLSRIRDDMIIMYQKYKDMFFVVSSRDFVILSRRIRSGNTMWIVGRSIEYQAKPPVKSTVRGDLRIGGWRLEEKEGGTQVTYLTWADPKGNLPTKAINMASSAQGQVVERLKKLLDSRQGKK